MTMNAQDYVTVAEMADMHGVTENHLLILLRADQKLPQEERRLPGAYKQGSKYRGEWRIPRATAETWVQAKRGPKSGHDE